MKMNALNIVGMILTAVGGIVTTVANAVDMKKTIADEVAKQASKTITK